MHRMKITWTIAICLFFSAFVLAQQAQGSVVAQDEPSRPHEAAPQPQGQEPEAKPEKPEKPQKNQENRQEKQAPASSAQAGQNRPTGKSGHIPDDKFRASFGKSHTFAVNKIVMVNSQPTFVYAGYSFILVNPWPAGWAYTDECYIDYIDGEYFLFDLLHPGVQVALFVSL